MKPCEVRCGNPSQYEAGKESSDRRKGGGSDIPGKVKSEFYSEKGKWEKKKLRKEHQKHQKQLSS